MAFITTTVTSLIRVSLSAATAYLLACVVLGSLAFGSAAHRMGFAARPWPSQSKLSSVLLIGQESS